MKKDTLLFESKKEDDKNFQEIAISFLPYWGILTLIGLAVRSYLVPEAFSTQYLFLGIAAILGVLAGLTRVKKMNSISIDGDTIWIKIRNRTKQKVSITEIRSFSSSTELTLRLENKNELNINYQKMGMRSQEIKQIKAVLLSLGIRQN